MERLLDIGYSNLDNMEQFFSDVLALVFGIVFPVLVGVFFVLLILCVLITVFESILNCIISFKEKIFDDEVK